MASSTIYCVYIYEWGVHISAEDGFKFLLTVSQTRIISTIWVGSDKNATWSNNITLFFDF